MRLWEGKMRQSIPAFAVCALLSGFAVVGCGGGDGGSTSGGSANNGGTAASAAGREGGGASTEAGASEEPTGGAEGGESSGAAAPAASKAEFVARANALCKKRQQETQNKANEVFSGIKKSSAGNREAGLEGLAEIASKAIVPSLEAEVEDLRGLEAPKGDEAPVEALIASIEVITAEAREDPKAFISNPNAFAKPEKLARASGLDSCGSPS